MKGRRCVTLACLPVSFRISYCGVFRSWGEFATRFRYVCESSQLCNERMDASYLERFVFMCRVADELYSCLVSFVLWCVSFYFDGFVKSSQMSNERMGTGYLEIFVFMFRVVNKLLSFLFLSYCVSFFVLPVNLQLKCDVFLQALKCVTREWLVPLTYGWCSS